MFPEDTISGISTPLGRGAIGIVRLSGPRSLQIVKNLFKKNNANKSDLSVSHKTYYGKIIDPATKAIIDEVLVTVMKAPRSYTREDMVEISCHGGIAVLSKVLDLTFSQGARPVLPGEFTKRAFLNGRIDLTQAEAVIDLINAKNEKSIFNTINQLNGSVSNEINLWRSALIDISSKLELSIDFSDEEIPITPLRKIKTSLSGIKKDLETFIASYQTGRFLREGIRVVIAGRTNTGKSSLFNMLVKKERSIVTHHPGTTRDFIEEELSLDGLLYKIFDTAGLRNSDHDIESIGIEKTYKLLSLADIIIVLIDASKILTGKDIEVFNKVKNYNKECLFLINKIDLEQQVFPEQISKAAEISLEKIFQISAKKNIGIEKLKNRIKKTVNNMKGILDTDKTAISNVRHKNLLSQALESIKTAIKACEKSASEEFIAFDIAKALHAFDEITGHTYTEEVLDNIFNEFCIGK